MSDSAPTSGGLASTERERWSAAPSGREETDRGRGRGLRQLTPTTRVVKPPVAGEPVGWPSAMCGRGRGRLAHAVKRKGQRTTCGSRTIEPPVKVSVEERVSLCGIRKLAVRQGIEKDIQRSGARLICSIIRPAMRTSCKRRSAKSRSLYNSSPGSITCAVTFRMMYKTLSVRHCRLSSVPTTSISWASCLRVSFKTVAHSFATA